MLLGVNMVSAHNPPAWQEQIRRLQLCQPDLVKVQYPPGFSMSPAELAQLLDAIPSINTVILRGEDGDTTLARNRADLFRGFQDLIRQRPQRRWVIELGNEPDLAWQQPTMEAYRDEALKTVRALRKELPASVTWLLSLPVQLANVQRVVTSATMGEFDGYGVHLYGHFNLVEGDENELSRIYQWMQITSRPLWITEAGINDPATPQTTKAERYLAFMESAPTRVQALALWASVSDDPRWANYRLNDVALRQLATRNESEMAITGNSPIKSAPRITRARFASVLESNGSPWANQAGALYDLIVAGGHDPGVWLAIAGREHRFGAEQNSVLGRMRTNSWTNARSVRVPGLPHEIVSDPVRGGPYVRYRNVQDSLRDGLYRVDDPNYVYQQSGAHSLAQVFALWTEDDAVPYTAYVVSKLNEWNEGGEDMAPYAGVIRGLIDRRGDLAVNRGSPSPYGPRERVALQEKRGVVIHYGGPPPANPGTFAVAQSYATFHVSKNWSTGGGAVYGDGLMYHVAIGKNGEKWLCRDLEAVLWHCGVTTWNRRALAIQFLLGGSQRATPAQLQAAREVVDDFRAFTSTPRHEVWGHQELSSTDCPGTLMADFVRPYRAGEDEEDDMPPPAPERIKLEGNPFEAGEEEFAFVSGFAGFVWQLGWVRSPADPYAGILSVVGYPKENERATDFGAEQKCEKATLTWNRGAAAPWDVQLAQNTEGGGDGIPPDQVEVRMTKIAEHAGAINDLAATPF